jgi:hypothetical protein
MNSHIIVLSAAFVELAVLKISSIVMIAACALIDLCTIHTTARQANTSRIVLFVRNIYSVRVQHRMKCHVAMRSIGNVSAS